MTGKQFDELFCRYQRASGRLSFTADFPIQSKSYEPEQHAEPRDNRAHTHENTVKLVHPGRMQMLELLSYQSNQLFKYFIETQKTHAGQIDTHRKK